MHLQKQSRMHDEFYAVVVLVQEHRSMSYAGCWDLVAPCKTRQSHVDPMSVSGQPLMQTHPHPILQATLAPA